MTFSEWFVSACIPSRCFNYIDAIACHDDLRRQCRHIRASDLSHDPKLSELIRYCIPVGDQFAPELLEVCLEEQHSGGDATQNDAAHRQTPKGAFTLVARGRGEATLLIRAAASSSPAVGRAVLWGCDLDDAGALAVAKAVAAAGGREMRALHLPLNQVTSVGIRCAAAAAAVVVVAAAATLLQSRTR